MNISVLSLREILPKHAFYDVTKLQNIGLSMVRSQTD